MNQKSPGQKTKPKQRPRRPPWVAGSREQLDHLYHKVLYWLYERARPTQARVYADRLDKALARAPTDRDSIFAAECRSLISEANGDLTEAIVHREKEIQLIRRLHAITQNSPQKKSILKIYGYDDLSDRIDLLATLYHERGDLAKALTAVRESRDLCRRHGVPFDGQDILEEIEEDVKAVQAEKNGAV